VREVRVAPDAASLARLAAEELARRIGAAVAARGRCDLALAGGATPRRLYALLAAPPFRDALPWGSLDLWLGDERCVPPGHPDSNERMVRETLLAGDPPPPARLHRIRGEWPDPEVAARSYEAELRSALGAGGLDVALLGMGPDGHVASLFPGDEALEERERWVRAATSPRPPPRRITLTLPALEAAAAVLLVVSGADKAERVAEVLSGRAGHLPAGRLAPRGEAIWLLDEAAAGRMERPPP